MILLIEMTPQLSVLLFILLLLLLTGIVLKVQSLRTAKRTKEKIALLYGRMPRVEHSAEEYESIGHFAEDRAAGRFTIDEITWNDLAMDEVFRLLNNTVSSPGEDVLSAMLRIPAFDRETLERREEVMGYFDSHPKERGDVLYALSGTGRKRRMSQYDYVCALDDAEMVNTPLYIFLLLLAAASIALIFFNPSFGVLSLFVLMCVNVHIQLKSNEKTRVYVESFRSILQMLTTAKEIVKLSLPVLQEETKELQTIIKKMQPFASASFFVTSAGQVANSPGDVFMEYLKMLVHVDMLKFNQMLKAYRGHKEECVRMLEILGTFDALISAASFRKLLPFYAIPEFVEREKGQSASLEAKGMYHPLTEDPVPNNIRMQGGNLITGSNASGKSTFLKGCAVMAILAQSIHTVPGRTYRAGFYKVMSSMALTDNLLGGESYFVVELKSLQRILAEAEKEGDLLCLVDEVLRGTNTVERIAASSEILKSLRRENVLSLAATHDIELTYILEDLYTNWHFEETVNDADVSFDYLLREGRATTRNAIALLKMMGFDSAIVENAEQRAERFEETGEWEKAACS